MPAFGFFRIKWGSIIENINLEPHLKGTEDQKSYENERMRTSSKSHKKLQWTKEEEKNK